MIFTQSVWAQDTTAAPATTTETTASTVATTSPTAAAPNPIMQFVPFIAMIAIMYFLVIRPQSKRAKVQQTYLSSLKRGDSVLTSSGIFGRIELIKDNWIMLEVSDGVQIKVLRSTVASPAKSEEARK